MLEPLLARAHFPLSHKIPFPLLYGLWGRGQDPGLLSSLRGFAMERGFSAPWLPFFEVIKRKKTKQNKKTTVEGAFLLTCLLTPHFASFLLP